MGFIELKKINEPQQLWGGEWTERKLNAFAKYVAAYLTIMKKNSYWKTIYFDGFAGGGDRRKQCNSGLLNTLFNEEPEVDNYKGSAERVLTLPDNLCFDFYYFIDKDKDTLNRLKKKIAAIDNKNKRKIFYKEGDCNEYLIELSKAMKKKPNYYAALVLLDPFGMQVKWDSIAQLNNTRTDIWILVPTGVIVNRLLDKNAELKHRLKLQSFFGLEEEEIKIFFYTAEKEITLFGEQTLIQKVKKPIEKIAELYIKRLKTIWKYVTEKPLVLENKKGVPIFHFVFASNNPYAEKIAKQIIEKI